MSGGGQRIKVLNARVGRGGWPIGVEFLSPQRAGKKPQTPEDFLRGFPDFLDQVKMCDANILAIFEYSGTPYAGWQAQPGLSTVQGEIEGALKTLGRRAISVQACGRTDAGVHALAMPASFQLQGWMPIDCGRA